MKKTRHIPYLIFGAVVALSAAGVEKTNAQVNEKRVLRQASGVYKGSVNNIKRVRNDPHHGVETTLYDSAQGKMRVPVTEDKLKTKVKDEELDGNGRAKFKGDGKKAAVKRGGNKVSYVVNKGQVDTLMDGHNPIRKGLARGNTILRGSKWNAKFGLKGKRIDNDSYVSTFSANTSGKH